MQGMRTSLDKNFFQEKTTESIISQMRASRKTKQALLITNLGKRNVASYPLEQAWIDLVGFYYAGLYAQGVKNDAYPNCKTNGQNCAGPYIFGAADPASTAN